ncbi:MAG: ECF transporter S component [Tissierellia bacterium]|nr:ECF transporter S component [Tissierellia bacterium]
MKNRGSILSIRKMTIIGVLASISIVLGLTPLGFIPVGPTRATIMHIPVIIGAIMEGPLVGAMIGLIFGLFSIFKAITRPTPVSFVFLNPMVSVLPRILIGILTYYGYRVLRDLKEREILWLLSLILGSIIVYLGYGIYSNIVGDGSIWISLINGILILLTLGVGIYGRRQLKGRTMDIIIAAMIGTLTNTVGVLSSIYFLYGERFVIEMGQDPSMARKIILGIGIANGVPEMILGVIVVGNVIGVLKSSKA